MKYGVKSKLYKRYIKEFNTYEGARVFCLKQGKIWTNATMQIYEIEGLQTDRLLEEFPPTKPTNYMKLKKSDIRSKARVTVDPKNFAPKDDDEFFSVGEAEINFFQAKNAKKKLMLYDIPFKTTDEITWWEKLMWKLTPTQTITTSDGILKLKQRNGQIYIVDILGI